ncbi:hypothetical protein ADUPG1_009896 [Aduncisulcus paluster]|uniref:Uncharacterized protein n=1 Tax=Aduncisulcus paluster TaxID=2918883 RepID=A0ABQ5KZU6_9EUKA|nr:hypothetical protein ADUPG1_009896 [Aduncisulcus paluster]
MTCVISQFQSSFVQVGSWDYPCNPPIQLDDPSVPKADASKATGYFSGRWDISRFREFLSANAYICFKELVIPFFEPHFISHIFIGLENESSNPSSLDFTFYSSDHHSVTRRFAISKMKHRFEWHKLDVDMDKLVKVKIAHHETYTGSDSSFMIGIRFVQDLARKYKEQREGLEKRRDRDESEILQRLDTQYQEIWGLETESATATEVAG